jgi:hypothetical protein
MHPSAQAPSAGAFVPHTPTLFICMAASSLLMVGLVAALVLL